MSPPAPACPPATRRRLAGVAAVAAALDRGDRLRAVVLPRGSGAPEVEALVERAAAAGIRIDRVGPRKFARLRGSHDAARVLALAGPDPDADLDSVMAQGGAVWLLTGPLYPGNVGFAIRTAEVSGADGLYIDNDFDHSRRRRARRASMRADRFLPIGWQRAAAVIAAARRAGKRVIGIEDVGTHPPWGKDLTGSVLLIVGGEADGIPQEVLASCDVVVCLPMAGFIASYNLQAAVAAVASERFRQQQRGRP